MPQRDDVNLDEVYAFALQLAKDAGKLLDDAWRARCNGDGLVDQVEKESSVDIVTQTDEARAGSHYSRPFKDVEAFIKTKIESRFPSHHFVGEEAYSKGASRDYLIGQEPTWCVDPLDGTVNYTHIFPMFCVSIAFLLEGAPVIGVINAPFMHQTFSACRGKGAWLNETQRLPLLRKPIPPMPKDAPKGCVFSCEWGKDRRDRPDSNLHRKVESFVNMAAEIGGRSGKGGMVHGVRSLGSATLDLAYCAMGSFDIWWEGGCWEWDVAAGIAILHEAGGLVTTANPPEDLETAKIEDVKVGSRLYLAIRPAGDSPMETARQGQERTVREVWKRVRHLDYVRPGA
ncbi:hypothetical protein LTR86_004006 [Recurvomyces mirabilis]|nr:hypothetical protein LTR86_004006 [Recurvomyces mirabilis]